MRVPRSFLEGFVMFLLMIPIAVYYLIMVAEIKKHLVEDGYISHRDA